MKNDASNFREPQPDPGDGPLPIFVVQRHRASHLHFDFRLETSGILKSWAVPKGPSMNPADKRLAVQVSDHPIDYAGFEGTIAPYSYGAGSVRIWDRGTWEPLPGFSDVEKALSYGLLEFKLSGNLLKGAFALVKMKKASPENG